MTKLHRRARRYFDGALDFDFYRRRAMPLRRGRIRYFLRRLPLAVALYAAALCVGVAVGNVLPLQTGDCLNCHQVGVDVDDARRDGVASPGALTTAGHASPVWP